MLVLAGSSNSTPEITTRRVFVPEPAALRLLRAVDERLPVEREGLEFLDVLLFRAAAAMGFDGVVLRAREVAVLRLVVRRWF